MIADGRSEPPPFPDEFSWILLARSINRTLGTDYRPDELPLLPGSLLDLLAVWVKHVHQ